MMSSTSYLDRALRLNRYIPGRPTPKQAAFLLTPHLEALFGGAAGPGKSWGLLADAARFVDVPGYAAIIFRKTYADLSLPGALMDRAQEWWAGTDAVWHEQTKTWEFPSGATITFGYLDSVKDKYRYQSAEFQRIYFDELSQFREADYRYLFSRLRRTNEISVPIAMRAASNPPDDGSGEWVIQRFIDEQEPSRIFIPAVMDENPHLDKVAYELSLAQLDPVTRQRLRYGDMTIRKPGDFFSRAWFEVVDEAPVAGIRVRYWDKAATEMAKGKDPDWTVGAKLCRSRTGVYYIEHIVRLRARPKLVEETIRQTAEVDGKQVRVWIEQEPGASGVESIDHYSREVLDGFVVRGDKVTGSKTQRAELLAAKAEAGNVKIVRGAWNGAFLDEADAFGNPGIHDDQIDAVSGGLAKLAGQGVRDPQQLAAVNERLRRASNWAAASGL